MKRYAIEQKFRSFTAFFIILILLPYIVSVFVNGADTGQESGEDLYVKVKVPDTEEADGVTEIRWTDYLAGILAEELPENSAMEAMKAQAVVIRTQLYRAADSSEDEILTESYLSRREMEEKWGVENYRKNYERYVQAVEETDDTVVMFNDTYAWTPFHQSSTGMTRSASEVLGNGEYPYIAVRECPEDKEADDEVQTFSFSYEDIQRLCREFLVAEESGDKAAEGYKFEDFEIKSVDSAGYVSELRIGNTLCTGDQFREALSLASSAFSLNKDGENNIKITTTGKGHGMGMSLWTADKMAKAGRTYEEILAFFFEGTTLRNDIQETSLFSSAIF